MYNGLAGSMLDKEDNGHEELITEAAFDNIFKDWIKLITELNNNKRTNKNRMLKLNDRIIGTIDNMYTLG